MNLKNALRNMGQLQALSVAMIASNVIMAAGLVFAIVSLSNSHERIVLVPPNMDQKAEIAWNSANKEYLKSFALYMAILVGNIQPKSSSVVLESVSAFMDPIIYTEFRRQLMAIIEDPMFKASGSVISFLPGSIQYEHETSRVFVPGTIITSSSGSQKYSKQVTYEIGVHIRQGRPWVSHFTSYEGTTPRTVAWYVNRNSRDGSPIPDFAMPSKWKNEKSLPEPQLADLSVMQPPKPGEERAEEASESSAPAAQIAPAASAASVAPVAITTELKE